MDTLRAILHESRAHYTTYLSD